MAVSFSSSGSTKRTQAFLKTMVDEDFFSGLESLGQQGVAALASATPIDTGVTASSWSYEIESDGDTTKVIWNNSHADGSVPVAILLQYGHGTGTGGYVAGYDYINPAIRPIFDQISEDVWRKVSSA